MDKAVKENYAGYRYKMHGEKGIVLNKLYDELLREAKKEKYQNYHCARLLESYITAYEDKHTHVNYLGLRHLLKKISEEEKNNLFTLVAEKIPMEERSIKEYLKESTDPLEGIYTNKGDTCVVLENKTNMRDYVGVMLNTDKKYWNRGEVKFELKRNSKNQYDYFFYDAFHSLESRRDIAVNEKKIDSWVKIFPETEGSKEQRNKSSYIQKYADNTLYLQLPTFERTYKSVIDNFLKENKEKLQETPNLILDLRGNGGGTDGTFSEIIPYLYTNPVVRKGVEFYCSRNTIEKFEELLEEEESPFLRKLIERMKANEGGFMPLQDREEVAMEFDTVFPYPKNIYIIVDRHCASSAEEFILIAKQSSKTKILGENTSGCLDFSNVVQFSPKDDAWWNLDYASSVSKRLPDNPVDEKGIAPDIYLQTGTNWLDKVYELIDADLNDIQPLQ